MMSSRGMPNRSSAERLASTYFSLSMSLDRDHRGNVLDDGVEELARASDLGRRRLALRHLTEMLARDEKADEPERDEQAEAQTGALQQVRAQERRRRHVDGERAHEIVDMPLRARLQLVVALDAALLARERRINRAEHHLAVGGQELRLRFRRGRDGESLDRRRHGGVGRRGLDLPAGTADPAQAETSSPPSCLAKASMEWARNVAGTGALAPSCDRTRGIGGHEGVDQPQRGAFSSLLCATNQFKLE